MDINLAPPGAGAEQWQDPVVRHGVPLGQGTNDKIDYFVPKSAQNMVKTMGQDEIDSILEGDDGNVGIGMSLKLAMHSSATGLIQPELDRINPDQPGIPLIKKFIEISEKMLKQGNLVAAQGTEGAQKITEDFANKGLASGEFVATSVKQDAEDNVVQASQNDDEEQFSSKSRKAGEDLGVTTDGVTTDAVSAPRMNRFLIGNAYIVFLEAFWESLRMLSQSKSVESKVELAQIETMFELTDHIAQTIMDKAKEAFWMHIASAILAAVTVVVIVVTTVVSVAATMRMRAEADTKATADNPAKGIKQGDVVPGKSAADAKVFNKKLEGSWYGTMTMQAIQQGGISATKVVDNIVQGVMELKIAEHEALKEYLQAYKQMAQFSYDKAAESFKNLSDQVREIISQLDQIRKTLNEAIVAMYKKS